MEAVANDERAIASALEAERLRIEETLRVATAARKARDDRHTDEDADDGERCDDRIHVMLLWRSRCGRDNDILSWLTCREDAMDRNIQLSRRVPMLPFVSLAIGHFFHLYTYFQGITYCLLEAPYYML